MFLDALIFRAKIKTYNRVQGLVRDKERTFIIALECGQGKDQFGVKCTFLKNYPFEKDAIL